MNIIFTNSFASKFDKFWGKEDVDFWDFADIISQSYIANTIYIHRPIAKLKINYNNKAIRLLIFIDSIFRKTTNDIDNKLFEIF